MGRWKALAMVVGLLGAGAASAQTVELTEARVWHDEASSKRMGLTPRGKVTVADGKVDTAACDTVVAGTKYGRALWGMKGKAYSFQLRAPFTLGETKKTLAGAVDVDATGAAKVSRCAVEDYDAAQDDPPKWPTE